MFINGINYKIIKFLGFGGFGATFLARERGTRNKFALKFTYPLKNSTKMINNETDLSQYILDRLGCVQGILCFKGKEIIYPVDQRYRVVLTLLNKYVKDNMLKSNWIQGEPVGAIVTTYYPGDDLQDYLNKNGPLDERNVLLLIKQILQSLVTLHSIGLYHRDIKPSNIVAEGLATNNPQFILIDFGISCFSQKCKGFAGTTNFMLYPLAYALSYNKLLPGYDYSDVDRLIRRNDVFALGVTAYEAATGLGPFVNSPVPNHPESYIPLNNNNPLGSIINTLIQRNDLSPKVILKIVDNYLKYKY